MSLVVGALLVLLAIVILRWPPASRLLAPFVPLSRIAPFLVAVIAVGLTSYTWGSLNPIPTVGDEAAYVLQARLLARGEIAGEAPPIPEFFEQAHVLVVPRLAPKYPIGFGLFVAPGVLVGATALVPLLLVGLTAALLFVLTRRLLGSAAAVLATCLWLAAPGARYRAGYFSETLTGATWLAGWYALLRWRDGRDWRWLALVALATAVAAITRPLTAIVFAIPVGIVVLRDAWSHRLVRQVAIATAVSLPVLALLPIQNVATGGTWRELPYTRYTTAYLPFDHVGLDFDGRAPTRTRPPDLERLAQAFASFHQGYTAARLPAALLFRVRVFFLDLMDQWAVVGIVLALLGTVAGPPPLRFAAGTTALLFLAHLGYAHPPQWSLYYAEAFPVVAALVAKGVLAIATVLVTRAGVDAAPGRLATLMALASFCAILPLPRHVSETRLNLEVAREPFLRFQAATAGVKTPAIIFVRYALGHRMHRSLIQNPADYATAPIWTVYDRGTENALLIAAAPGREAWIYDERWERLEPAVP